MNIATKKTNPLYTLWIVIVSLAYTGYIGLKAISHAYFCPPITRQWVNQTLYHWTLGILSLAKVQYKVVNPHQVSPPTDRPVILMCNHSSLYDIPLSFLPFPKHAIRMLAKKELDRVPFLGGGMRVTEFPLVNRHNRQQAIQDLNQLKKLLESGIIMWLAPEGTRSKNGKLGPFKKGGFITAIQAGAVIIPFGIRGANQILPAKSFRLNLNQQAEIHVGLPIDAAQYTLEEKEKLMEVVRDSMITLIN